MGMGGAGAEVGEEKGRGRKGFAGFLEREKMERGRNGTFGLFREIRWFILGSVYLFKNSVSKKC
jgi:hypothetical protein